MKILRKLASVALLLAILVLLNRIAQELSMRTDVTEDRIYSISPATRSILEKMEKPVTLDFYWSESASSPEIAYKDFAIRVRKLLGEYVRAARGKLILHEVDPRPDSPEEEGATAAGIRPQVWPSSNERFYFGLVATQDDQHKVIQAFTPDREPFLEFDLSELIWSVQQIERKRLGLLTSLPLQGSLQNQAMMQISPDPQCVVGEWEKSLDVLAVDRDATTLPEGLDALAVIHPEGMRPGMLYAIDQFILSGRPVFLALDPSSNYFRQSESRLFGDAMPDLSSDLARLLRAYGIDYDPKQVVADPENSAQTQVASGLVVRYPVWVAPGRENLSRSARPTAQLDSMLLPEPGSFSLRPGSSLSVTPLIESGAQSGCVPLALIGRTQPDELARRLRPSGKKILAGLITGRLRTAFPNGRPAAGSLGTNGAPEGPAAPPLAESRGPVTLFFIADTDWLMDHFSARPLASGGMRPINDNVAFGANVMDYLCGSQELVGIRGKGTSQRPFEVVRRMQARAESRYKRQLDDLETRLGDVQRKLHALESEPGSGKQLLASPEVEKSIADFQGREADLQHQRRGIRLALREDIEALGNRLLVVNLVSTPLLLGLFGLWFNARRRRQKGAKAG